MHQQNGSAEPKHRHIIDVGLSLLAQASMQLKFCDEAFTSACFLINRQPNHVIQQCTPMENLSVLNLITHSLKHMAICDDRTYGHTTGTNSRSSPNSVCSLVTTIFIRGTNA